MTPYKTPTEALAQLRHLYVQLKSQDGMSLADRSRIADGLLSPAIAALEKWGQPAQAGEAVAREPLPKFLALKFHARRDKKATVTLLFHGHEAADAWVRGIKGGQP